MQPSSIASRARGALRRSLRNEHVILAVVAFVVGAATRLDPPVLAADDDLDAALEPMCADHEHLRVVGFVHGRDVIEAYNQSLLEWHAKAGG